MSKIENKIGIGDEIKIRYLSYTGGWTPREYKRLFCWECGLTYTCKVIQGDDGVMCEVYHYPSGKFVCTHALNGIEKDIKGGRIELLRHIHQPTLFK